MAALLEFSCPNCDSEMNYDAEKKALKCLHCLSVFPMEPSNKTIDETSILSFKSAAGSPIAQLTEVCYKCKKCGQETKAKEDIAFFECQNCGFNVVNPEAYSTRAIVPSSIIPFSVSKQQTAEVFKNWIGKGFWNDSSLKDFSIIENLKGHYVPFWTFDAMTENHWSGYSGTYYYETRTYKDSNGNEHTERIQHTNWTFRSGVFDHFFDDILVCAEKGIPLEYINEVYPFNLQELKPIDEEYLLGWDAKAFDEDMDSSYQFSRDYIDDVVESMSIDLLKDDTYKGLEVETIYSNETFKHIILPIWICEYLFKGKKYSFIVNGQTGKISGKKPLSTTKIVLAVIIALMVIAAIIYFANQ
jgi:DNA-directed RNA polymerase subunit RPC12/RpoP